uniref:Secretin n=1 Tax=Anas platyrhynchos platyrhynchos TaxID=8840 RepID=A0A493T240_ANAPP
MLSIIITEQSCLCSCLCRGISSPKRPKDSGWRRTQLRLLSTFSMPCQSARTERHADGLFHSELSKMKDNAYVQQLVKHLVGLKERSQRHSDGLFTSEYSKMRGNAQVQKFIQNLMGHKRR